MPMLPAPSFSLDLKKKFRLLYLDSQLEGESNYVLIVPLVPPCRHMASVTFLCPCSTLSLASAPRQQSLCATPGCGENFLRCQKRRYAGEMMTALAGMAGWERGARGAAGVAHEAGPPRDRAHRRVKRVEVSSSNSCVLK